jgi:hypothetical protein
MEHLAEELHWKMEHWDPTGEEGWVSLTEEEREFFRQCVKAMVRHRVLVRVAMEY